MTDLSTTELAARMLKIPALEQVSEAYAGLVAKRSDLSRQLAAVNATIEANTQKILESKRSRQTPLLKAPEVPNDRVAALLGEQPPRPAGLPLDEENRNLHQQARDIQDAINVLTERIGRARIEASAVVCRQIEPEFRALLSEIASRMAAISRLALEYRHLAQRLNQADIAWSDLDPMGIRVGGVAEKGSQFTLWLTAAAKRGYLNEDLLPREIKP